MKSIGGTKIDAIWFFLKGNRGASVALGYLVFLIVIALAAPYISAYNPIQPSTSALAGPSIAHPMGTDSLGRDTLTRLMYGAKISFEVGIIVVSISSFVGILSGSVAGYYGGKIDAAIMRVADVFLAFPGLVLAIAIIAAFGNGIVNLMIALSIVNWPNFARVVRSQCLSLRTSDFVKAAKAIGSNDRRILFRHLIPNSLGPMIILISLGFGWAILAEAGLSFLGLGVQAPFPSWGNMIATGRDYFLFSPWSALFPGLAITTTVLAFNVIGDGLRDALDPRMRL